jgi:large subunit ribosomal protein L37Ae
MGSRYGVKIRKLVKAARAQQTSKYECPKCGKKKVKHTGFAVWECRSCGCTFAGGAYTPETNIGATARKAIAGIKPAPATAQAPA